LSTKLPRTTQEEFASIVARSGLRLAPNQVKEFHLAHDRLMVLLARLRRPDRPRDAEPMAVFRPEPPAEG
jgi:hypothetical protein